MITNVMQQYTRITTYFLKEFTKAFLQEQYVEKISNAYISTYVEVRLCNFGNDELKFFYRRIYETLNSKKLSDLGYSVYERDTESAMYTVENTGVFFLGKNNSLYIIYPYGNTNNTSEIDIIVFE